MYTPVINCNLVQDKPAEISIMNAPEIEIYQTKVLLIKLDIPVSSWVVGEGIKEFSGFSVHPTEVTATLSVSSFNLSRITATFSIPKY